MFNNMKNKIREKTGSELPKFSLGQIQQKVGLGRHSRQGSETSLSSIAPDEDSPSLQPRAPSPMQQPARIPEDHPPPPPPSPPTPALRQDSTELTLVDGKAKLGHSTVRGVDLMKELLGPYFHHIITNHEFFFVTNL